MTTKPVETGLPPEIKKVIMTAIFFGLLLTAVIVAFGTVRTIPAGHRGIVLTWGNPTAVWTEGLHFKWPIAQSVVKMSVQTQKVEAKSAAASKDLQDVSAVVALNYHVRPESISTLYRNLGVEYADRVISPAVQESVKASTAQFTAEELITKRAVVKDKIDSILAERLSKYGIEVETTSITDFTFSAEFTKAIEAKVTAQQQALQAENDLTRIKTEAEQKIASARAEAESLKLINEQLTQSQGALQIRYLERWDGTLPLYIGSGSENILFNIPLNPPKKETVIVNNP